MTWRLQSAHARKCAPRTLELRTLAGEDWPTYYAVEPTNFTGGSKAEAGGLIVGVEVCMWSEFVDASNFIPRTWPRAGAVAERGWSAADVVDVDDARNRLHHLRCELLQRGIPAEPITNVSEPRTCMRRSHDSRSLGLHHPQGGHADEGGIDGSNFCPVEWHGAYRAPWN